MECFDVDDPRSQVVEVCTAPCCDVGSDRRHGIESLMPHIVEGGGVQPEHLDREIQKCVAVVLVLRLVEQLV